MKSLEYKNLLLKNVRKANNDVSSIQDKLEDSITILELKYENGHIEDDKFKQDVTSILIQSTEDKIKRLSTLVGKLNEMDSL